MHHVVGKLYILTERRRRSRWKGTYEDPIDVVAVCGNVPKASEDCSVPLSSGDSIIDRLLDAFFLIQCMIERIIGGLSCSQSSLGAQGLKDKTLEHYYIPRSVSDAISTHNRCFPLQAIVKRHRDHLMHKKSETICQEVNDGRVTAQSKRS